MLEDDRTILQKRE